MIQKNSVKPKKRWGQHFLKSRSIIKEIIRHSNINPNDTIIEIGSGTGNLTIPLAQLTGKVIAIERDKDLVKVLQDKIESLSLKNVEIIQKNILQAEISLKNKYKVVANLPFNIALRIIRNFLQSSFPPEKMVLIVQKEVAERICAKPPKMRKSSVLFQLLSKPKIIRSIPASAFWPPPKVESALLVMTDIRKNSKIENLDIKKFSKILEAGFKHPRKQLWKNLSQNLSIAPELVEKELLKINIDPQNRPEALLPKDWVLLTLSLAKNIIR